jgi:hypothetical protein
MYHMTTQLENLVPLVQVKDTGNACGNGAFATSEIPHGAYIGDYEGELLNLEEYYQRYPTGTVRPCCAVSLSSYCCYSMASSCMFKALSTSAAHTPRSSKPHKCCPLNRTYSCNKTSNILLTGSPDTHRGHGSAVRLLHEN